MPVEIISVGSEFIIQDYRNTEIATIAYRLLEIGIEVDHVSSVSDQESRLEEILRQAIKRSTLIFVLSNVNSGEYDTTKKLLTRILKKRLVLNYRILDGIRNQYELQGDTMPRTAEKLALVPNDAEILESETGTVPGFLFSLDTTHVILLPDNTADIDTMLKTYVLPRLDPKTFHSGAVKGCIIKACGLATATVKEWLKGIRRDNWRQTITYAADGEETSIIVTVRGTMQRDVELKLETLSAQIRKKLGNYVYGSGSQTLEGVLGACLKDRNDTLAVAESCTGGLIAHKLTNVPGSSAYFDRGVVCYSNDAKMSLLDVSPNIIEEHGAVSAETAIAMAEGVRWISQTSYGLAVTGIAGPSGGTPEKPVGLVYIALASASQKTQCHRKYFSGNRGEIKARTAQSALDMLRHHVLTES
ncbi:nicotinamide-nucleotide amidohydrolase family protein [candidate division KSB3 bacterium]|uniref:CinA-like protein n=1 Tax=candidate division KSB3 bacterium TaxID=2044937 RepID=A0A9D5JTY4_9BACT|nr:nicotinamide-nucleotide amidohydrolase family protein [candidate division KSB3 bacterium]MBD3324049.1 nicotinamide-nucleotide amidohydrolase family protein [candidate division KSB3 bacterium]